MSDQLTPAPEETQETPIQETETPVEDTSPSPVVDYEQRYNNLRPDYDRKSQRLAELETEREQWLEDQQGQDEYEDDDYVDPYNDRLDRLETLYAQREQETLQWQAEEQETAYVNNEIGRLETEQSEEFTDEEWETIGILSERYRREDGSPDVDRAFEHLFGKIVKPRREKYVSTKKAPKVQSGPPAAEIPDLDTSTKRAEYMDQRMVDAEL